MRNPVASAFRRDVYRQIAGASGALAFDLSEVRAADGGVMALLVDLRSELASKGVQAELVGASGNVRTIVDLYSGHEVIAQQTRRGADRATEQVGGAGVGAKDEGRGNR